jgi:hypothetical protein
MEASVQLHAPAALNPEKEPLVHIGPQSCFGRCAEEKILALPGIEHVVHRYTFHVREEILTNLHIILQDKFSPRKEQKNAQIVSS